jgi:hypothetical protein
MSDQTAGSGSAPREALTIETQAFGAARLGERDRLVRLLEAHPNVLTAREPPYGWTLLHRAAHHGQVHAVNLLLERGLDPNTRESGDPTYPIHWAAAGGHLEVVRRLADAGGDVVGAGDDHQLEVIGWATCWEGTDDLAHRAVVDELVRRGARHHIFSAIAMNLAPVVRGLVTQDPSVTSRRMSRNENHQTPLHFAVRMGRREMVELLLELGADPLSTDGFGHHAAIYATSPDVDRPIMEAIRALARSELVSAERGHRPSRGSPMDLIASLSLSDWALASRLVDDTPNLLDRGGALHLAAKRGEEAAVDWLLGRAAPIPTRNGPTGMRR